MELEQLLKDYKELQNKYDNVLKENNELKEHLKKYTSPERNKKFYQNHKDTIKKATREHQKEIGYKSYATPEKRKEYNRKAYEKRKEKLKSLENNN